MPKRMTFKAAIIFAALIAAVLLLAARKPDTFTIQRSITINASADKVFGLIDDFHEWPKWAPQDKEDPSMKREFSGPARGVGAVSDWNGAGKTGSGRMTIIEAQPPSEISVQADWAEPFKARNVNDFVLQGAGSSTQVTWSMTGPNLFIMKVMGVFVNMDRAMGKHFEAGLANLKQVAEQPR
jgi:uncharacterized protein YndB with AHSA1/START domain